MTNVTGSPIFNDVWDVSADWLIALCGNGPYGIPGQWLRHMDNYKSNRLLNSSIIYE